MTAFVNNIKSYFAGPSNGQIHLERNKSRDDSSAQQIKNYMNGTMGAYRFQVLTGNICLLADALASNSGKTIPNVKAYGNVFKTASLGLTMPHAVASGIEVGQAFSGICEKGITKEGILDTFQKTTDFLAATAYSALMLTGNIIVKPFADTCNALADLGDVLIASDKIRTLRLVPKDKISDSVRLAIDEEESLFMLKWAKAIAAFAPVILSALAAYFVAPLYVLLSLGVASSAFAVTSHFYKENMYYRDSGLIEKLRNARVIA